MIGLLSLSPPYTDTQADQKHTYADMLTYIREVNSQEVTALNPASVLGWKGKEEQDVHNSQI